MTYEFFKNKHTGELVRLEPLIVSILEGTRLEPSPVGVRVTDKKFFLPINQMPFFKVEWEPFSIF